MSDKETEVVHGTVGGITQKGEQWIIEVTPPGSQYAKKLRTKSDDTRAAAAGLYGQTATFECGVSHWEYEGKPVTSLWVNAINPGAPPPSEPPGAVEAVQAVAQEAVGATESAPQPVETVSPVPAERNSYGDPKQASIERQVAVKSAAVIAAARPAMTLEETLTWAEEFDKFLARVTPF